MTNTDANDFLVDIANLKAANGGHWGGHPQYTTSDWAHEVMEDSTRLGYWEWVDERICDDASDHFEDPTAPATAGE